MMPRSWAEEAEQLRRPITHSVSDYSLDKYLSTRRQALLIELGNIEDLLGLKRTKEPNKKS